MLLRGGEGHRGVASDSQTAGLATDNWHMFFFFVIQFSVDIELLASLCAACLYINHVLETGFTFFNVASIPF